MKKIAYLIVILLCSLPINLFAQKDSEYLAGAVPEREGKVVFSKEYSIPGATEDQIYQGMYAWLTKRMAKNENESRIILEDKSKGQIVAMGEEYLVFTSKALMLDRAIMKYQLHVLCKPEACTVELSRIRYEYEKDENYTAEGWITDDVALNKTQTKLSKGSAKFGRKTVDFAEDLFEEIRDAIGIPSQKALTVKTSIIPTTTPVTATETATPVLVTEAPVVVAPAVVSNIVTSNASMDGYRSVSPDKIPGNIIKMLSEDWMLVTAGNDQNFSMMTASWGGLGRLYEKSIAMCFINPARNTFKLLETNDTYTFTFYTEAYRDVLKYCGSTSGKDTDKVKGSGLTPITTPNGSKAFSEAWLIIECKKMVSQSLIPEALNDKGLKEEWAGKSMHKMFIGEIINVWVK